MVTVTRPFIILLISSLLIFFLSSPCSTNSVTSHLLIFFFFLRCRQTHPNINTSTQTNQHKDTLAPKKKKTHRYTNTHTHAQTNPHRQTTKRQIGAWLERSELMGLAWSELVGMGLAWSELGRSRSDLIGAYGSELGRSMLDRVLPDWSCGSVLVTEMVWISQWRRTLSYTSIFSLPRRIFWSSEWSSNLLSF